MDPKNHETSLIGGTIFTEGMLIEQGLPATVVRQLQALALDPNIPPEYVGDVIQLAVLNQRVISLSAAITGSPYFPTLHHRNSDLIVDALIPGTQPIGEFALPLIESATPETCQAVLGEIVGPERLAVIMYQWNVGTTGQPEAERGMALEEKTAIELIRAFNNFSSAVQALGYLGTNSQEPK